MNYVQIQQYLLNRLKLNRDYMQKYKKATGIYLKLINEKLRLVNNNCYKPVLTLMKLNSEEDTNFRLIKTPQGMCFSDGEKIFPPNYKDEDFRKEGYCVATIQKPHWVRINKNIVEIYECEQHPYLIIAEYMLKEEDPSNIILDFKGTAFKEFKQILLTNETGETKDKSEILEQNTSDLNEFNNELIEDLLENDDFDY